MSNAMCQSDFLKPSDFDDNPPKFPTINLPSFSNQEISETNPSDLEINLVKGYRGQIVISQNEEELQNLENMGPDAHAAEVEKELNAEEKRKNALGRADERIKRSKVSSGTISMYLSEISQYEPLPPDREVELAVLIAKGDKKAMKELVEANLRFVVSVAKKYQGNGLSLSDIINEGNLGLIKAAKRFDPSRGFKFISYAVWWIRQAILQALAEQGRLIRLPLNRVGTITKITKAAEKLEAEMGRPPKVEEISHQLDVKSEEVFNALQYSRRHSSLDAPFAEGEDSSLINVIEDEQEKDPDNKVMDTSMKEEIASALSTLTERERSVIEMYFGINRDRSFTLNEIGEQFSLTRERVRQIKEKAIRRLAHKTRSEPLRVYLGQ